MTADPDIARLRAEAKALPGGAAKIALLEEAVRRADTAKDDKTAYELRRDLMFEATFAGRGDLTIVAMSWCLAKSDQDPQTFPLSDILWSYKYAVAEASNFPTVSRSQINALLDDLKGRFIAAGSTLFAVHYLARYLAMEMGDLTAAVKANAALKRTPRDSLSDCRACVSNGHVNYLFFLRRWTAGIDAAIALIESQQTCAVVPRNTYGRILIPLLRLGRAEEAVSFHETGIRVSRNITGDDVGVLGSHIMFLALTGNLDRAARLCGRVFPIALASVELNQRFGLYRGLRMLCEAFDRTGNESRPLRFAEKTCSDTKPTAGAVKQWVDCELKSLASAFDKRNGNGYHAKLLVDDDRLWQYAVACPVSKS